MRDWRPNRWQRVILGLLGLYLIVLFIPAVGIGLWLLRDEIRAFVAWWLWDPLEFVLAVGLLIGGLALVWRQFASPSSFDSWPPHLERVVSVLTALVGSFALIHLYVRPTGTDGELRVQIVQLFLAATGGVVVLSGSYVAWRNYLVTRRRLELDEEQRTEEGLSLAVQQLHATNDAGVANQEARLLAVHQLERYARIYSERGEDDTYRAIMSILTRYVREQRSF
jgi:hypothetical protein